MKGDKEIFESLLDYVESGGDGPLVYVAEDGACDECESYNGLEFEAQDAPGLPIHPNCKCYFIAATK